MLILAIDTSNRTGSVALLRDNDVLAEVSGIDDVPYSTRLFQDVTLLQSRAPFRMDQIDVFAVASGPGSFTGLRVGLAAVKAWAEVYGKPVAAISALESVAEQSEAFQRGNDGIIAPFLDARRGQLFGALYRAIPGGGSQIELVSEAAVLSAEEFLELVDTTSGSRSPLLVSPTPDVLPPALLKERLPAARLEVVSGILAPTIGRLGYHCAQRGNLVDAVGLDANYVRRNDAESTWKDV